MQGTICAWANYAQADRGRDRQGQRADRVKRKGRAGALQDVPLGQKDGSWSFPHSIRSRSVADAPRPDEILVVMGIADGGRVSNDLGTGPIRQAEIRSRLRLMCPVYCKLASTRTRKTGTLRLFPASFSCLLI